ncbi:HNH endonuclease signature motif containing protein [Nocardioides sp.]|uniref:HNH endonuclease signature motif containing protein n=1 Tax=Nocardioides sp. TaxID=35761 RepID=UPI00286E8B89|nr:HNH endonuclease signature motif containing protein [Nocardioides sp.]
MSAGDARRLACTANLVPVVLGAKSEILDVGRAQRLFNAAQRRALAVRDKRCRAEGCDMPAAWSQAHHPHPCSRGGETDLANAILLCSHHHHRAHDDRFQHERLPNGDLRFHRRT